MQLPLTQWMLQADSLPEHLLDEKEKPAFSLPGAAALSEFADLIGGNEQQDEKTQGEEISYAIGGLFEEGIGGEVVLSKEIDFGAYTGDRALLTFSQLAGSGEIDLDGECIARFGGEMSASLRDAFDKTGMPCALCLDVSDALHLGKSGVIRVKFDAARPAGVVGAAFLSVTAHAHLSRVSIQPDAIRRTMTVRARVCAQQAGRYVLRIQAVTDGANGCLPDARETDAELEAGEEKNMRLSLQVDAPVFVPGQAYAAPALKIQLFARQTRDKGDGLLCDDALLMCGYGCAAPRAYVPVLNTDDPKTVCARLRDLGIFAAYLPSPAQDGFYQALTRAGIAVVGYVSEEIRAQYMRYPCLTLADTTLDDQNLPPEAAAWQMLGSVAFPRAIDRTMTRDDMLLDASGKKLDAEAENVRDALAWLRVVQIRLRAEAARQGRYQGALCSAEEAENSEIQDALRTAFAPVHLSALPLSGAWWTGTRFSASLEAYVPEKTQENEAVQARAVLEDDEGEALAQVCVSVNRSGYIGVIEAQLPDHPCVLTLRCMLLRGGEVIEESVLPVYVGERGPLEAVF